MNAKTVSAEGAKRFLYRPSWEYVDGEANPVPGTGLACRRQAGLFYFVAVKACFYKRRENIGGRLRYQVAV
jgi:hypothetical protein